MKTPYHAVEITSCEDCPIVSALGTTPKDLGSFQHALIMLTEADSQDELEMLEFVWDAKAYPGFAKRALACIACNHTFSYDYIDSLNSVPVIIKPGKED